MREKGRTGESNERTENASISEGTPEVYAVRKGRAGWTLTRRGLLTAAVGAAALPRSLRAQCPESGYATRDYVHDLAISPDGRLLASDDVNAVNLWSLPDGALLKSLSTGLTQYSVIRALAISPDGRLLAAGLENGEIHLWSLPDGAPVTVISAHPEPGGANGNGVSAVTIGRNGVMVSAGGDTFRSQGKVKLWSLPDGLLQTTLTERHCGGWWISPDRRLLAFGQCEGYSSGARVELRSLPDGAVKATLTGFQDYLLNLIAMSPDGQLLVSNTRYGQPIKLWSVPDNKVIKEISLQEPEWGWSDLIISPDGRWLAAGVYSSTPAPSCVKLWSLPDATLRKTLTSDFPVAVTISPDGEWLASGGVPHRALVAARRKVASGLFHQTRGQLSRRQARGIHPGRIDLLLALRQPDPTRC